MSIGIDKGEGEEASRERNQGEADQRRRFDGDGGARDGDGDGGREELGFGKGASLERRGEGEQMDKYARAERGWPAAVVTWGAPRFVLCPLNRVKPDVLVFEPGTSGITNFPKPGMLQITTARVNEAGERGRLRLRYPMKLSLSTVRTFFSLMQRRVRRV